jgi:hypothetical protein
VTWTLICNAVHGNHAARALPTGPPHGREGRDTVWGSGPRNVAAGRRRQRCLPPAALFRCAGLAVRRHDRTTFPAARAALCSSVLPLFIVCRAVAARCRKLTTALRPLPSALLYKQANQNPQARPASRRRHRWSTDPGSVRSRGVDRQPPPVHCTHAVHG